MTVSNFQKLIIFNVAVSIIIVLTEELMLGSEFYQAIPEHLESNIGDKIINEYYGSVISWMFVVIIALTLLTHITGLVLIYLLKKRGRILFVGSSAIIYLSSFLWGDSVRIGSLEILYLAENASFGLLLYAMFYTDLKNDFH